MFFHEIIELKKCRQILCRLFIVLIASLSLNAFSHLGKTHALDANGNCLHEYPGNTPPQILNQNLLNKLTSLCFTEFSIYHSGVTATPLWVAQHLTGAEVNLAYGVDREDVFHPEERLAKTDRAELSHYRGSGYDRGHLAPAADMATIRAQDESFSMANMIPQMPQLNRGPWAKIEKTTRELAKSYGEIHVISGPVFIGNNLKRIGVRVLVPSDVYKAIYLPSTGQSSAWWASNTTGKIEVISISELSRRTGINIFPALPESAMSQLVQLPTPNSVQNPKAPVSTSRKPSSNSSNIEDTIIKTVLDLVIGFIK